LLSWANAGEEDAWTEKPEEEGPSGGERVAQCLLKQGKIKGRGDENRSPASFIGCNCSDILVGSAAASRCEGMTIVLAGGDEIAITALVGLPMSDLFVFENGRL